MHRAPRPVVPRIQQNRSFSVPSRQPEDTEPVERFAYSISETAEALGLSESTVKRLIKSEELEVVKVLTRTLVPLASIQKLLGS